MAKYQPRAICWKNLQCKFLGVQTESVDSSIGDLVTKWPTHWLDEPLLILEHMTSHWLSESYPGDLWPMRHLVRVMIFKLVWTCWHFRQLRTWIHDIHCVLTIKSDTGQHLQFLLCLVWKGLPFFLLFRNLICFPLCVHQPHWLHGDCCRVHTSIQIYQHVPLFIHCDQHPWKYVGDMSMPIPGWLQSRPSGRRSWCWSG